MREFELYHGAAIMRLLHYSDEPITITSYPTSTNASYVINDDIGIYIKHTTKRLAPWGFSFHKEHQDEILDMYNNLSNVYVILVCWQDGIVALSFNELKNILDHEHEDIEWVRVHRRPKQKYTVTGSDGKLKYKIGNNEYPRKILLNKD